jgi:hypothetical protein
MIFQAAYLINESRRYNAQVKNHYFTKAPLRNPNAFKVFLGISYTNAVIPPKFYKIKIRIINIVLLVYF